MKLKYWIGFVTLSCGFGCMASGQSAYLEQRVALIERQNALFEASLKKTDHAQAQLLAEQEARKQTDQELRRQSAEIYATIDALREEMREVTGKVEESDHSSVKTRPIGSEPNAESDPRLSNLSERLTKIERHLGVDKSVDNLKGIPDAGSKRPAEPEIKQPPAETKAPADVAAKRPPETAVKPPTAPVPPPAPVVATGDKKEMSDVELYESGKKAFDKGDTEIARDLFTKYLKRSPKSKDADNAQFWIGEIYYRDKWYEKAIMEYQKVIENYPDGNKVPAALLKQGLSFFNLNEKSNARLILQEIVTKYPKSNEAKIAKEKLSTFK